MINKHYKLWISWAILTITLCSIIIIIPNANATHDPNDFFVTEATFPGIIWAAVDSVSGFVVAAGGSPGGGPLSFIAHRTSGTWNLVPVPNAGSIFDVKVISPTLAYAIGQGDILKWDGVSWSIFTIPGRDVTSGGRIIDTSSGLIFFFINSGLTAGMPVVLYDGATFTETFCGAPSNKRASKGSAISPNEVVFWGNAESLGEPSLLQRVFQPPVTCGATIITSPTQINSVHFVGGTNFSVGQNGIIFENDVVVLSSTMNNLYDVFAVTTTNVWAVGLGGTIIHRGPSGWTSEPSTTTNDLFGVTFFDGEGWAVGRDGIIQKLQVNPVVALPILTTLQWDPSDLFVTTSEAQCFGDEVALGINFEPSLGAGGFNAYIIDSDTNIVIEMLTGSAFYNLNNKHLHTSRIYPTGEYTFLVTADVTGLLAPDNYAAESFSVPIGSCIDEVTQNNFINETFINQTFINQTFLNQTFNGTAFLNQTFNSTVFNNQTFENETFVVTNLEQTITANLGQFFWIILVISATILYRYKPNPIWAFIGILFSLFSIFWGITEFETLLFDIIVIGVGLILMSVGMGKINTKWRREEGEMM